jgi:membrane-associated phospholipid phosphatase
VEAAAILIALVAECRWRAAAVRVLAFTGNGVATLLKLWFGRPRPAFDNPILTERGSSFPSSHAVGSAIVCGMLVYLCMKAAPRRWLTFATLFGSLIVLIGLSRIYLGAHSLSDLIGSDLFGLGWILLWVAAAETWLRGRPALAAVERNPPCLPNAPG